MARATRSAAARAPRRAVAERERVGGGERRGVGGGRRPGTTDHRGTEMRRADRDHQPDDDDREHQHADRATLARRRRSACGAHRSTRMVAVACSSGSGNSTPTIGSDVTLRYSTVTRTSSPTAPRSSTWTSAPGSVRCAARTAARSIGIDARGACRLAGRVHDAHLVAHDEPDLDHREDREHDERQHEGELDRGLAALAPPDDAVPPHAVARGGTGHRVIRAGSCSITLSNSFEIA